MTNKLKAVSEKIQKILEKEGFALQPFISYLPHAIVPNVRLVDLKEIENANKGTDTTETGVSKAEDGAVAAE